MMLAIRNVLIAMAYIITGWVGLRYFSNTYATTIFLPSGIAIGAIFLYGPSALGGVIFGSFILNIFEGYRLEDDLTTDIVTIAACIAFASACQAVAGGLIFRKVLKFNYPYFVSIHNLVVLSIRAPFICMISCTVAVNSIWFLGVEPWDTYSTMWLNWWVGDTVGVLIAIPWMLFLLPVHSE